MSTPVCTTNDFILMDTVFSELNAISSSLHEGDTSLMEKMVGNSVIDPVLNPGGIPVGAAIRIERRCIHRVVTVDTSTSEVTIDDATTGERLLSMPFMDDTMSTTLNLALMHAQLVF